jgi:ubiquinone/menaquinone biosynthesis C-methylase UbiE
MPRPNSNQSHAAQRASEARSARDAADFWRDPLAYRQVAVGIQHVEGARLLALHSFDPRTLIIDLGTGDGSLAFDCLLPLVPDGLLVGVDKSQSMLEGAARYVTGKPGAERVSFVQGDVVETDGEWLQRLKTVVQHEGRPIVVYSSAMLHHIYNPDHFRLALRNIAGLLQEATGNQPARFLASFAGEGNFDLLITCCDDARSQPEWSEFFRDWKGYPLLRPSAERMKLELLEAGFDVEVGTVELAHIELLLDSEERLFAFVRGCMRSFMGHLQQSLQARGVDQELQKGLLDRFARQVSDMFLVRCDRGPSGEVVFPVANIEISVAPAAEFRVADFTDGVLTGDSREWALVEFLERVNRLPEVQKYKPIVRDMLRVEPGHAVLDAGCGTGVDGVWLLEDAGREGKLFAVDRNAMRVRYTAERFSRQPNVEVTEQDLSHLSFPDNSLDRIYCERVLIHAADPAAILHEFKRVLKPGGRIVLVEPDFTRITFSSIHPDVTARIVAARASEITNPDIGARLCDIGRRVGLEVVVADLRQLQHSYEASKLLDLNDIQSHPGGGSYPDCNDVQMWLVEQSQRAEQGSFYSATPMHLVTLVK